MKQQTLAMAADQNTKFERFRRPTRRDEFLATMERLVLWASLCEVIEPHYPKAGNGRPPVGLERMLRMYFVQHWFNLADEACEEALLDSTALRGFVGIDLGRERVPDATTLLKFRRMLEKHKLGEALFAKVGQVLQDQGLKVGAGTIVDTTIISAPSSTKNRENQRDPEMHQTCKGQQWYFGMKLHIGVDAETGLAHSAVVTAANVHDKHPLPELLHGQETSVWRQCVREPARPDRIEGAAGQRPDQSAGAKEQPHPGTGSADQSAEVAGAFAGGAHVRGGQAAVGLQQGALPGAGEERHPGVCCARTGQHLPGAQAPDGIGASAAGASGACRAQRASIRLEWGRNVARSSHCETLVHVRGAGLSGGGLFSIALASHAQST